MFLSSYVVQKSPLLYVIKELYEAEKKIFEIILQTIEN